MFRPKTQEQFFQKPQACGIFKPTIFFSNNTQTDFKLKGLFYCTFLPKIAVTIIKLPKARKY